MISIIENRKKNIEKLRNQTFSWRTQKPRTKRNQNQDEKPKLKSFFFFVISISYKKEKKKEKNLSYQRIQKRKRKISYLNVIKKKKKSYLNLKRGKECTGASSNNLMVAATFTNTISVTLSNLNYFVF